MLAIFSNLSFAEVIMIAAIGIMVFGRKLPRIAVEIGTQLTKMRRNLNKVWRETGVQDEIRRMQREMRQAEYEVRDAVRKAADAEEADEAAEAGFEGAEHDAPYHEGEVPPDADGAEEEPPDSGETSDEPEAEAERRAEEPHPGPDPYPGGADRA